MLHLLVAPAFTQPRNNGRDGEVLSPRAVGEWQLTPPQQAPDSLSGERGSSTNIFNGNCVHFDGTIEL